MNESPNKLSRQSPEDRGVKRRTAERRVSVRSLFGDENWVNASRFVHWIIGYGSSNLSMSNNRARCPVGGRRGPARKGLCHVQRYSLYCLHSVAFHQRPYRQAARRKITRPKPRVQLTDVFAISERSLEGFKARFPKPFSRREVEPKHPLLTPKEGQRHPQDNHSRVAVSCRLCCARRRA